jgi:hypothetical protein
MAEAVFKQYNPCKVKLKDGKFSCFAMREYNLEKSCCDMYSCKLMGESGCTTKNLSCKLFLCDYAERANPEAKRKLKEIRDVCEFHTRNFFMTREEALNYNEAWGTSNHRSIA